MVKIELVLVWIPSLLRDITQGLDKVTILGSTIREIIDNVDVQYPGFKERLLKDGSLRPNLSILIDGNVIHKRLQQEVTENNEIFIVPAIAGG